MTKANMRLSGHELYGEGRAFEKRDGRMVPVRRGWGSGGTGQGKFSCGAFSTILSSGTQRKQWHREHKNAIRAPASNG